MTDPEKARQDLEKLALVRSKERGWGEIAETQPDVVQDAEQAPPVKQSPNRDSECHDWVKVSLG